MFDQGNNVYPRYVCAKVPKPLSNHSAEEANHRFINELRNQLSYSQQIFVHWAFDFLEVLGTPVALFRYWGSDLEKLMREIEAHSKVEKLSILVYVCSGLSHCYKKGLVAHQDLKPANIFLRNVRDDFQGLPDFDIYSFAMIADFGLANAYRDSSVFDGSRPYMAPEQWTECNLSSKTDIFALGIIFYELMTGGFHPVGIKLSDYWPRPVEGNSKKWTRADSWRIWANNPIVSFTRAPLIEPEIQVLIKKMLSFNPDDRPSIEEVKISLLEIIRSDSHESYAQLAFLVEHYEHQAPLKSLEESWPYLWKKWTKFQEKFEKGI